VAQRVRNDLHILSEPNVNTNRRRKENIETSGGNGLSWGADWGPHTKEVKTMAAAETWGDLGWEGGTIFTF
jgi:hypothetical protein